MSWDSHESRALSDKARTILASVGAFVSGDHVVLTSGRHSDAYVDHDQLFEARNAASLSEYARLIACAAVETGLDHSLLAFVGPETGGWHLSHWAAYHYNALPGPRPCVRAVCAQKDGAGGFRIAGPERAYLSGARALIIDDVLTTGMSACAAAQSALSCGAVVDGLLVACDRSGKAAHEIGFGRVWSLFTLEAKSWSEEDCPMCQAGTRVNVNVGHGAEYLLEKVRPPAT